MITPNQSGAAEFKAFDWSRHHSHSHCLNGAPSRHRGQAFDAAGSSGFAFLKSALELIVPRVVEPLQSVTHPRDIPIIVGGGFPEEVSAWAVNYGSTGGGFLGIQGTNNTDIAQATIDIQKGTWKTYNWMQGFSISFLDLERAKRMNASGDQPPFSLQQIYEKSVRTVWNKALDYVTYLGNVPLVGISTGQPGLINNPNVPVLYAPNGGSGSQWSTKSPTQVLSDVNLGINQTWENSGYSLDGIADTLLLPPNQFALLTQPMSIGGVGYDSTIEYIRRNCVATQYFGSKDRFKIFPLPANWISGQGLGGSDRAVFYRNDEECVQLRVPTMMEPAMTLPTDKGGAPGYSTYFAGNFTQVMFLRTTTAAYVDGV